MKAGSLDEEYQRWLKQRQGRLVVVGGDARGQRLEYDLRGARLVRCNLGEAVLWNCLLMEAELLGCTLTGATLWAPRLARAQLHECNLDGARVTMADLRHAHVAFGSAIELLAENPDLDCARVLGVDMRRARLIDANLAGAAFVDCDLREAAFVRTPATADPSRSEAVEFIRCDLRGASFEGLGLAGIHFADCRRDVA
jgi:uncharacterized protein YjbI with pentapeptide repeats